MTVRMVIFGAGGFLGGALHREFPEASVPRIDIADGSAVREVLRRERPDVIINAAGKTGRPNVDWCEVHRAETIHSNVIGPLVLNEACQEQGVLLVHIGTGCVYMGDNAGRGFSEQDVPNFSGSFYSRTKACVDSLLAEFPVLVLRPRMPFDGSHHPRNLLSKLVHYPRVLDEPNSLTYIPDFVNVAKTLIEWRATGVYNVVNPGVISPYEIMQLYQQHVDARHSFDRLETEQLEEVATAGRSSCHLSVEKLDSEGITMPPVRVALLQALNDWNLRFKPEHPNG